MKAIMNRFWIKEVLLLGLFIVFIFNFKTIAIMLQPIIGVEKAAVEWAPLYVLAYEYLMVVIISSGISFLLAFTLGVMVHLFEMKEIKALLLMVGSFGTTFPTIAIIAILVPSLGYGFKPVIVALILYGVFPILMSTIHGLEQVDPIIKQASKGIGMNPYQQFYIIELPLAMPLIIAGLKTSFIINIAAATVGAVVGAGGLGMPIVSGIRTNDPVLMLKGAIPVALIALLADTLFTRVTNGQQWRTR